MERWGRAMDPTKRLCGKTLPYPSNPLNLIKVQDKLCSKEVTLTISQSLMGPQEDIKILHGRGFIRANCTLNIDPCEEVGIDVQETEGPYQILIEKVFLSGIH
mmetsp:Transcript_21473/g.48658  ORF Transcript_21473/g.48658 Transcript_21473/m.48658 type:complete len:103 (-) Transcript_21473:560-868(-)